MAADRRQGAQRDSDDHRHEQPQPQEGGAAKEEHAHQRSGHIALVMPDKLGGMMEQ